MKRDAAGRLQPSSRDLVRIERERARNRSWDDIAAMFGVSRSTVTEIAIAAGLHRRPARGTPPRRR